MNPTELVPGQRYNDASRLYPNMVNPLEFIEYDKDYERYVFYRLSAADNKTRLWKVYIGEYSLNDYVRPLYHS